MHKTTLIVFAVFNSEFLFFIKNILCKISKFPIETVTELRSKAKDAMCFSFHFPMCSCLLISLILIYCFNYTFLP